MVKRLLSWWRTDERQMSAEWLREQDRRAGRIEFHGVTWRWPINRRTNEAAHFNRRRLRRSA